MGSPAVRVRSWVRGSDADVRDGLLGWISVELGPLLIDNIALRRMADGRLGLAFPSRTSKSGRKHSIVRPIDDAARRAIEAEILGQLGQHSAEASRAVADG